MVSIGRAARELGVHPDTLRRWERLGKIEVVRTPTGLRRYDPAKLRGLYAAQGAVGPYHPRHGERFHCLPCGWDGDADVGAAMKLLAWMGDAAIHRWTPVDTVQRMLEGRFRRRKETGNHPGDPVVVGNGTLLPAGLQRHRRHPVLMRDGTATEAVPNDPHRRSANNKEKPVQAFA